MTQSTHGTRNWDSRRASAVPLQAPTAPLRRLGRIPVLYVAAIVDHGNRPAPPVVHEDFDGPPAGSIR